MILARMEGAEDLAFDAWTIVEPEPDFQAAARQATAGDARFRVVYLPQDAAGIPLDLNDLDQHGALGDYVDHVLR